MRELTHYTRKGWDYEIIKRAGMVAIAEGARQTTGRKTWEVIRIQSHGDMEIGNGVKMTAAEFAPSDRQRGTNGWTFTTLEAAEKRFAELTK